MIDNTASDPQVNWIGHVPKHKTLFDASCLFPSDSIPEVADSTVHPHGFPLRLGHQGACGEVRSSLFRSARHTLRPSGTAFATQRKFALPPRRTGVKEHDLGENTPPKLVAPPQSHEMRCYAIINHGFRRE